jgi:hypothetical protein
MSNAASVVDIFLLSYHNQTIMHYLFKLLSLIIFGLALAAGYYALQLFINQSSLAGYTLAMLLIIIGAALLITAHDLFRCRQWKDVGKALGNFAAMVCGYSTK